MLSAHRQAQLMRLRIASVVLCLFTSVGCGRLGYEPIAVPANPAQGDAGVEAGADAATDAPEATDDLDGMAAPDTTSAAPDGSAGDMGTAPLADSGIDAATVVPPIVLPYAQGFEASETTWSARFVGQVAEVSRNTMRSRMGAASLGCLKGAPTGLRYMEVGLNRPLTSGEIYSRVFIYAPSSWQVTQWVVPMEMKGTGTHDGKFSFDLETSGYGSHLTGDGPRTVPGLIPRDKWVCVELGLGLSAKDGWTRLFVDGVLIVERTKTNTLLNAADPGIARFRIGMIPAPAQREVEFYFDDWVISTSYVGCGN